MTRTPLTRSEQMARIRGRDTLPEVTLRRALWKAGLRYRLDARTPLGRPDVTIVSHRLAVFVDGCFWHGCPEHYVRPRSSSPFWSRKLVENFERDRRQTLALESAGWRVVRVWEHEIVVDLPRVVVAVLEARDAPAKGRKQTLWRVIDVQDVGPAGLERRRMESLREPGKQRTVVGPRLTTKPRRRAG